MKRTVIIIGLLSIPSAFAAPSSAPANAPKNTSKKTKKSSKPAQPNQAALPSGSTQASTVVTPVPKVSQAARTTVAMPLKEDRSSSTAIRMSGSIAGTSVQDELRQTRSAGFGINLDIHHSFLDKMLVAHIDGGATLEAGSSQAIFADEYTPSNRFVLNEAALKFIPYSNDITTAALEAGAIDQARFDAPGLIGANAFPGALESARFAVGGPGNFVEASAEQAIPVNTSLSTRLGDSIGSPSFFLERAKLGLRPSREFGFEGWASYFSFSNLPHSIAHESRYLGNSVTGLGASGAEYLYGFSGFESGAKLIFGSDKDQIRVSLGGSYVNNLDAPMGANGAILGFARADFNVSSRVALSPRFEAFRNESDASPAYYNSSDILHSNRTGVGLGMGLLLPRDAFELETRWVTAQPIETSPFQANTQVITIKLRKAYDLL